MPEIVLDASNRKLLRCIELLLADEHQLAEAARRSYRHQLGFWKFVLMIDAGECLRLHFWDRPFEGPEDIHSHCANFHSRVVLGSLTENSFDLVDGDSHARFRYRFDSIGGHSEAIADGLTAVRSRERRTFFKGESYSKRALDLHNVHDVAQGTVTVSAWGARDGEALVLKDPNARVNDCMACAGMHPSELNTALRNIIQRLQTDDSPQTDK